MKTIIDKCCVFTRKGHAREKYLRKRHLLRRSLSNSNEYTCIEDLGVDFGRGILNCVILLLHYSNMFLPCPITTLLVHCTSWEYVHRKEKREKLTFPFRSINKIPLVAVLTKNHTRVQWTSLLHTCPLNRSLLVLITTSRTLFGRICASSYGTHSNHHHLLIHHIIIMLVGLHSYTHTQSTNQTFFWF